MTLEEQGAYRNLLDEASLRGGPLPNDERILGKACGDALRWRKVRQTVLGHFYLAPDGWRNETLDGVLKESEKRAEKQRNYRNNHGNGPGNGSGNGSSNADTNTTSNNARPPDPDPVLRRSS